MIAATHPRVSHYQAQFSVRALSLPVKAQALFPLRSPAHRPNPVPAKVLLVNLSDQQPVTTTIPLQKSVTVALA